MQPIFLLPLRWSMNHRIQAPQLVVHPRIVPIVEVSGYTYPKIGISDRRARFYTIGLVFSVENASDMTPWRINTLI
jgi:hypothetical protein